MAIKKMTSLSTTMSSETKKLLEKYCKSRGLKMSYFIEQAVIEKLEDDMDSQIVQERANEPTVSWKRVS